MNFTQFPPQNIQELVTEYPHEIKENFFSSYLEDVCGVEKEARNEKK